MTFAMWILGILMAASGAAFGVRVRDTPIGFLLVLVGGIFIGLAFAKWSRT